MEIVDVTVFQVPQPKFTLASTLKPSTLTQMHLIILILWFVSLNVPSNTRQPQPLALILNVFAILGLRDKWSQGTGSSVFVKALIHYKQMQTQLSAVHQTQASAPQINAFAQLLIIMKQAIQPNSFAF